MRRETDMRREIAHEKKKGKVHICIRRPFCTSRNSSRIHIFCKVVLYRFFLQEVTFEFVETNIRNQSRVDGSGEHVKASFGELHVKYFQ